MNAFLSSFLPSHVPDVLKEELFGAIKALHTGSINSEGLSTFLEQYYSKLANLGIQPYYPARELFNYLIRQSRQAHRPTSTPTDTTQPRRNSLNNHPYVQVFRSMCNQTFFTGKLNRDAVTILDRALDSLFAKIFLQCLKYMESRSATCGRLTDQEEKLITWKELEHVLSNEFPTFYSIWASLEPN
ncbi:hypothetical protein P9112_000950 [Eukaryota sp. TZLM1-RC]